jgi:hypothetical protein
MRLSPAAPLFSTAGIYLGLILTASPTALPQRPQVSSAATGSSLLDQTEIRSSYGNLALGFEANRGQADPSVEYLSHVQGYTLFLRHGDALLALRHPVSSPSNPDPIAASYGHSAAGTGAMETSLLRIRLIGGNTRSKAEAGERQTTRSNYFIGNDPSQWRTGIPNYGRIRYAGIYPGVDLVYYGNQRRLEHDFVVAPSANPRRIVIALQGAQRMHIDSASGDLVLTTAAGEIRLLKPAAYQQTGSKRTAIASGYKLLAQNRVAFHIGRYDRSEPLVIDPVLVYSTYLGGSGLPSGNSYTNGQATKATA